MARWRAIFPSAGTEGLWSTMTCSFLPPQCLSLDFKIRHRIVYTGVILNRLDRSRSRDCARCSVEPETLEHLFLDCPVGAPFRTAIRGLLRDRCGLVFGSDQDWRRAFLFGVKGRPGINPAVVNLILALARYCTWITRNHAMFEGRSVNTWLMFTNWALLYVSSLRGHTGTPWRRFLGNNTFLTEEGPSLRLACTGGILRDVPLSGIGPCDLVDPVPSVP